MFAPSPGACAPLVEVAGIGGKPVVLVDGDAEDFGVLVEDALGAVSVMHVPVHHRGAPDAVGVARMVDRDPDVREDAEAAAEVRLGVVAGRAHERIAVVDRTRDHRIHHRDGAARGEAGDLVAAVPEGGPLPRFAATLGRERDDLVDVLWSVDPQELLPGRRPGPDGGEIVKDSRHFHEIPQAPLALGALRVLGRLYPEAGRIPQRRAAGVVPHVELVEEKSGLVVHRHLHCSLRAAPLQERKRGITSSAKRPSAAGTASIGQARLSTKCVTPTSRYAAMVAAQASASPNANRPSSTKLTG